MLKIRFILLLGVLLGGALSIAALQARSSTENTPAKSTNNGDRKVSQAQD